MRLRRRRSPPIYKTLILTGLRRGELESITVGQLELDAKTPHLWLEASDAKNRKGAKIQCGLDAPTDDLDCSQHSACE